MCIYFDEMIYFYIMLITFLYVFFDQIKSTLFIYDSFFLVSKPYELNTLMQVNIIIIEMIHNIMNWNYTAPVLVNVITVVIWISSSNDNEAKLNQKMVNILWKTLYGNFCLKLIVVSSTESTYCPSISSPLEKVPKISTFLYYYDDSVISLRKRSVGFWIPGGMSVIL